ncbi:nucleotide sugar dehydrogenase [Microaceticoccus formicicus]|uniref:nucleotide sugar dehydrogenase n=1 Tax=Microaceticoccus formicicus TaxID=3118105 RepID=UPI003CD04000|nr:nucleotide sugar dehydrogenase [Peptoniphilaceae bacterium AMB_02]
MEKILENTYRNVNIGLVNEFAILAHKMGIDIWEVVDAAKTKPYGFQAFYPGPGVGGHCIPLDPFYLTWKAREFDMHMPMIEASGTINDRMPSYVVDRSMRILSRKFQKALNGAKVLILGIAYKNDIDDLRDSPALVVIEEFLSEGAEVDYYDALNPKYKDDNGEFVESLKEINPEIISKYDLVVITTNHSNVDYRMVVDNAKYVFDTRYATKGIKEDNLELL